MTKIETPRFYITLGQSHVHRINGKTLDKDCVVEISAPDYREAHSKAMRIFGGRFHNCYYDPPDMKYFPKGIVSI